MRFQSLMLVAFIASAACAHAKPRTVECLVESAGKTEVKGPCHFSASKGGTFSLSRDKEASKPLYGAIRSVTVYVLEPGKAEVRGLTEDGINSRWGEATRSTKDPACWEGSDFRICAR